MCFLYESAEFASNELCTARKAHCCCGCRNGIKPGELYERASAKVDGQFITGKTCGACLLDIWLVHVHELAEGCWQSQSWCAPEELAEYLEESGMEPSTREAGQAWLRRLKRTGDQGLGTKAGWEEFFRERRELAGVATA